MNSSRRVLWGIRALVTITIISVIGYMAIEGGAPLEDISEEASAE